MAAKIVKNTVMSANDVIYAIYDEFKKRRREYDFPITSYAFNEYDEHEGRTYSISTDYTKAIKVGNSLMSIGKGNSVRMKSIGDCLILIPIPKGKNVEELISESKNISYLKYAILFNNDGKLCIPKTVDAVLKYVFKPSNYAMRRDDELVGFQLYDSTISQYDHDFFTSIVSAIGIIVGLDNKQTKKLTDIISVKKDTGVNGSYRADVKDRIKAMKTELSIRIDIYGEFEYKALCETLDTAILQLDSIR